jgi:hypothetical protein
MMGTARDGSGGQAMDPVALSCTDTRLTATTLAFGQTLPESAHMDGDLAPSARTSGGAAGLTRSCD